MQTADGLGGPRFAEGSIEPIAGEQRESRSRSRISGNFCFVVDAHLVNRQTANVEPFDCGEPACTGNELDCDVALDPVSVGYFVGTDRRREPDTSVAAVAVQVRDHQVLTAIHRVTRR